MGEYSSCISMAEAFNLDKERLKMALKGQLMCGESESGFDYTHALKEDCEAYIIKAFDNAVYHCLSCARSARALERIMEENGLKPEQYFQQYVAITNELEIEDEKKYPFYYEEELETGDNGEEDSKS